MHETSDGRKYIGMTKQEAEKRFHNGEGYAFNKPFYDVIKKEGWENIKHTIVCSGLSLQEAAQLEIELIREFDTTNKDKGFNTYIGNSGKIRNKHKVEIDPCFGKKLKSLRKSKGMTMQQLADIIGTSQPAISFFESGSNYPKLSVLEKLATALSTTVEELIGKEGNND
jgi:DNA-binding XRE family transcriptional regulator